MGRAHTASTAAVDPAERIDFWNSGSSMIGGVRAEAMSEVFDAEVAFRRLDQLTVGQLSSSPHRVSIFPLRREARALRLRYQQSGTSTLFEGHRSFTLHPGEWMVIDPQLPHTAVNSGDVSNLWLQVPCACLPEIDVAASLAGNPLLPMSRALGASLIDCMHYLLTESGDLSHDEERAISQQLTGMFCQALQERPEAPPRLSSREEMARRARAYVERNLQNPELSVKQIAQELGCTPRYVHKAFEGAETVSRYIWNRRLDMCRNRLEKQPLESETLTTLAFDYGFNSSSHFSRSFRERFGTSPSSYLANLTRRQD